MSVLNSFNLSGHRALITGSSAGIGLALAEALAQAGAHVVLNGRTASKVDAAAQSLKAQGLSVSTSVFDVTDADSVRAAVDQIEAERRGDGQRPPELATRLSGFEVMNEAHADAGSPCEIFHSQTDSLAARSDQSAEPTGVVVSLFLNHRETPFPIGNLIGDFFIYRHPHSRSGRQTRQTAR